MGEITAASQLLKKAESAIVVFTRGNHFTINSDGSGSTGHWRIKANLVSEKVIVYCRKEKTNEVYIADFAGLTHSPEANRRVILLRNIVLAGTTTSNWFKFGGRSQSPVQFITHTTE